IRRGSHMVNEWDDFVIEALGSQLRELTDEESNRLDSPDELPSVLRMTLGELCFRVYRHGGGTLILAIWDSMELSRNGETSEPIDDNLLALNNCGSYRGLAI